MRDVDVANAELVGLWFQLLATGAYLVYFPRCVAFVAKRRLQERSSTWLPAACTIIFVSTLSDQVLALVRAYQAFSVHGDILPNPTAYYADTATPLCMAKNSFNIILTLLSDIIIVYRTYVIWGFNVFVIVIPICLIIVNLALGILTMMDLLKMGAGDPDLTGSPPAMRLRYYFVMTFCLNIICASLICWKIRRVNSSLSRSLSPTDRAISGGSATEHVFEVIIQSAGIYCAHLFALIITDAVGTNAFFIFLDPLPPLAATTFSMLIVRARSHYSVHGPSFVASQQVTGNTMPVSSGLIFWENRNDAHRPHSSAPIGVEVSLDYVVHTDADMDMGSARGTDSMPTKGDADVSELELQSPVGRYLKEDIAEVV